MSVFVSEDAGFTLRRINRLIGEYFSSSHWSTVLYATITGYHPFWGRDWRRLKGLGHSIHKLVYSDPLR
jgi:hypothetical protein